MFLTDFFQQQGNELCFSREQGSAFAKQIADDFNPLHDIDAKRFCVPGDLLFAWTLQQFGLSGCMDFYFQGMVDDSVALCIPEPANEIHLVDKSEKSYLRVVRSGENLKCADAITALTRAYVAFSGHTFPHILVPLMASKDVMITPSRPMVMYQSMHIQLNCLNFHEMRLEPGEHRIEVDGKRGQVVLVFDLYNGEQKIGQGEKVMLLSGLKAYDESEMSELVEFYQHRKQVG